jgi:hypothetical protein
VDRSFFDAARLIMARHGEGALAFSSQQATLCPDPRAFETWLGIIVMIAELGRTDRTAGETLH